VKVRFSHRLAHCPTQDQDARHWLDLHLPVPATRFQDSLAGEFDNWESETPFRSSETAGGHVHQEPCAQGEVLVRWRHKLGDALPWDQAWRPVFHPQGVCARLHAVTTLTSGTELALENLDDHSVSVELRLIPQESGLELAQPQMRLTPRSKLRVELPVLPPGVGKIWLLALVDDVPMDAVELRSGVGAADWSHLELSPEAPDVGDVGLAGQVQVPIAWRLVGGGKVEALLVNRYGESCHLDWDPARDGRTGTFPLVLEVGQLPPGTQPALHVADLHVHTRTKGKQRLPVLVAYRRRYLRVWPARPATSLARLLSLSPYRLHVWRVGEAGGDAQPLELQVASSHPDVLVQARPNKGPDGGADVDLWARKDCTTLPFPLPVSLIEPRSGQVLNILVEELRAGGTTS